MTDEAIETESRQVTVQEPKPAYALTELTASDIVERLAKIEDVQRRAMKPGLDYGVIPGTGSKPTLLKAGAEKLCVLFRLDAQFTVERVMEGDHLTAVATCTVYHQVSGQRLGSAIAICSSRESKYAYRKASRKCPQCGREAIIKGRAEYGGGWLCFKKKDGCGAKFEDTDTRITDQPEGRVPNEDVADQFPTVIRMAEKRALVAAVRLVTGASAIFDEDMPERERTDPEPPSVPPAYDPEAKATDDQWALVTSHAKRLLGAKDGKAWCADQLQNMGIKVRSGIKVRTCAELMAKLTELKERMAVERVTADDGADADAGRTDLDEDGDIKW